MDERPEVDRACWCGATRAREVGRFTSGSALVECGACGTSALHPPPTELELARAYDAEYYGPSRAKFVAPIARAVGSFQRGRARLVARRLPRGARVLDVGCGNGGFLLEMARRGYAVAGTERTTACAARVPGDAGITVHVGDLLELELAPHSFDAVTLWHVFEHLDRPLATLERIRGLLAPRGFLFLSLPNVESAQARRYGVHWFHHDPPRHLFGFGPRSLEKLLAAAGFALERASTFSLEQNPFGEVQSARPALRLAQGRRSAVAGHARRGPRALRAARAAGSRAQQRRVGARRRRDDDGRSAGRR